MKAIVRGLASSFVQAISSQPAARISLQAAQQQHSAYVQLLKGVLGRENVHELASDEKHPGEACACQCCACRRACAMTQGIADAGMSCSFCSEKIACVNLATVVDASSTALRKGFVNNSTSSRHLCELVSTPGSTARSMHRYHSLVLTACTALP
jgi:hypothetical protein